MRYEDIERASELGSEIVNTKYNIDKINDLLTKDADSIFIGEYSDDSGWSLRSVFHKGNYHNELHTDMLTGLSQAYTKHLARLEAELEKI